MTVRFTAPDEGTHMRVLLVEDTERLRELTAAALRKSGFAVDAFGTIGEAEQAAADDGKRHGTQQIGQKDGKRGEHNGGHRSSQKRD